MITQWFLIVPFVLGAAFATYLAVTPVGSTTARQQGAADVGTDLVKGHAPQSDRTPPSQLAG